MTIQEMHIGIDLLLQRVNSNINTNFLHEEKDYYINITIHDFINAVFNNEKNTTLDYVSAIDIKRYYNILQSYIRNSDLQLNDVNWYYEAKLPNGNSMNNVTIGVLVDGVRYRITTAGTTDLSTFGYYGVSNVVGDEFECSINEMVLVTGDIIAVGRYKILNAGGFDFTTQTGSNAKSNDVGTVFDVSTDVTLTLTTETPVLKPLTSTPIWAGTTTLKPLTNVKCYLPLSTSSLILTGDAIITGSLVSRTMYIVDNPGATPIDLSNIGGVTIPSVGYIFTCTSNVSPIWTAGSMIHKVTYVDNRVVIFEEANNFLNNKFGSIRTSPIYTYIQNTVRVYHMNKFKIHNLKLAYILEPVSVDWNNNIDSDLPEYLHSFIMDLVVKRISSTINDPNYQERRIEMSDNKQLSPNGI